MQVSYKHYQKSQRSPEVGQYSPKFTLMENKQIYSFPKSVKHSVLQGKYNYNTELDSSTSPPSKGRNIDMRTTRYRHVPAVKFRKQIGRKSGSIISVNEKRFDFVKPIEQPRCAISFQKQNERPQLFKQPEFLHEYYINLSSRSMKTIASSQSTLKSAALNSLLNQKLMNLDSNI